MEILLLPILWLVFAFIAGGIASSKGHSYGNGFVGGCIFGIFGILYWLLAKDKAQEDYNRQVQHWHQQQQWQHQQEMERMQRELNELKKAQKRDDQ